MGSGLYKVDLTGSLVRDDAGLDEDKDGEKWTVLGYSGGRESS